MGQVMTKISSFRDLKVWRKAHELALYIYQVTKKFPPEEKYELVSQMRRAILSVATNIVEGFRRVSLKESLRFYDIANASLEELRYETQVSSDLGYLSDNELQTANEKFEEVSKMLNSWIRSQMQNMKRVS